MASNHHGNHHRYERLLGFKGMSQSRNTNLKQMAEGPPSTYCVPYISSSLKTNERM